MSSVFEQTSFKGMSFKNRLVRSATWEGMCGPDGRPTDKLVECYRNLAEGGKIVEANQSAKSRGVNEGMSGKEALDCL